MSIYMQNKLSMDFGETLDRFLIFKFVQESSIFSFNIFSYVFVQDISVFFFKMYFYVWRVWIYYIVCWHDAELEPTS